jgi:hypothetical protein
VDFLHVFTVFASQVSLPAKEVSLKSKEIAALLIASSQELLDKDPGTAIGQPADRETIHSMIGQSLRECTQLIQQAAASTKGKAATMPDEVLASRLREAFTKWKAVVRQVKAALPQHPIAEHMLPSIIAAQSAPTYERLKKLNAFLGYETSSVEKEVELDRILANAMRSAMFRLFS